MWALNARSEVTNVLGDYAEYWQPWADVVDGNGLPKQLEYLEKFDLSLPPAAVSTAAHTPMPFTMLDEGSAATPATSFTVAGHSSGGSMASQHFVTFSDRITGLGHIDAAPYGCSKLQSEGCKYNCACKGDAAVSRMLTYAQGSADAGRIAPLSHVKAARVWVMSGGSDTIVNHTVGAAAADLYRRMGADVIFHIVPDAEHAFVTDSNGSGVANACGFLGAPFINVSFRPTTRPSALAG